MSGEEIRLLFDIVTFHFGGQKVVAEVLSKSTYGGKLLRSLKPSLDAAFMERSDANVNSCTALKTQ